MAPEAAASLKILREKKFPAELNESSILAICAALILLIFFIDVSLVTGTIVSILYVIPILVCIWSPKRRTIFIVAGVSSILTLVAIPLKPPGDFIFPLINRPISLLALWTVTGLVDRFNISRKNADS